MTSAFSASGEEAIKRPLNNYDSFIIEETLDEAYEISRSVDWIVCLNAKRVALQFPDELLVDAPDIAKSLEKKTNSQVFILGDTTYGSCCVDEIAAEHIQADAIIHYGGACLSQNQRLPVLYVFANLKLDHTKLLNALQQMFPSRDSQILVATDVRYYNSFGNVHRELISHYPNLMYLELDLPESRKSSFSHVRCFCGRFIKDAHRVKDLENWTVVYIGEEGPTLTNLMLTLNRCPFVTYNPKTNTIRRETLNVNQALRKRYFLIEKAKDANIIGILVATLGVANYLEIIDQIKRTIKSAGKKHYTFVVGKLNPAKLANFPEIDVYTLVSCAENSLLDSRDFYRPIITPFELEVALNSARHWTGDYVTDFRELLPGSVMYVPLEINDEEQTDVSLVSGRLRNLGVQDTEDSEPAGQDSLVTRNASGAVAVSAHSGSDYLRQRSWRGLEPRVADTRPALATPGRRGIAAGYEDEGLSSGARGNPDGEEST